MIYGLVMLVSWKWDIALQHPQRKTPSLELRLCEAPAHKVFWASVAH